MHFVLIGESNYGVVYLCYVVVQEYAELLEEFMRAVKQNYGEKVLVQVIYQIQHLQWLWHA